MSDKKNPKDHGIEHYQHLDLDTDVSEQLKDVYSNWADSYDDDNDNKLKTVSQPNTVQLLMRHCTAKAIEILDVGCGTGIVGQHLKANDFTHFDGTDPSQEMMEHARSRGYTNLLKLVPGNPLPVEDNATSQVGAADGILAVLDKYIATEWEVGVPVIGNITA